MSEFIEFKLKRIEGNIRMAAVKAEDILTIQDDWIPHIGRYVEIRHKHGTIRTDEPFAQVMKKIKDAQKENSVLGAK